MVISNRTITDAAGRCGPSAAGAANASHFGRLAGSSTLLVRRHDGLTGAVLFNCDETPEGKTPASLIDGRIHAEVNRVAGEDSSTLSRTGALMREIVSTATSASDCGPASPAETIPSRLAGGLNQTMMSSAVGAQSGSQLRP